MTIAPVEVAARSDAMDRRLDVGSAAGVGNVGVADGRGLWAAKSASAGAVVLAVRRWLILPVEI